MPTSQLPEPDTVEDSPSADQAFRELSALPPGTERQDCRSRTIDVWLPMAYRLATRFRNRGEPMDDLRQVAAMGLVKAVDRFDPTRGNAFETYAIPTVTGELKRHFRDHTWDVHVPRRVQELRNQVRLSQRDLSQRPGVHVPTPADVAADTGLSEEDVKLGMQAMGSYSAYSLDAEPAGADGGTSLADRLGSRDRGLETVLERESVKPGLRELSERERTILYLRYFRDMSQASIGQRLGISQMHVSRLLRQTCERLRTDALPRAV
ncbi:SigB/SigF/SigG family RNA polymerase sigma factor [Streptomyces sp. NPDC055749]